MARLLSSQWALVACLSLICMTQAQQPLNKWEIVSPSFTRSKLDLFLEYPMSDYIPFGNLKYRIYQGRNCGNENVDITVNDYLLHEAIPEGDWEVRGDGSNYRNMTISFVFDPDTIRGSQIFTEKGLDTFIRFCTRISAYTGDSRLPSSIELFYRDTYLDVNIGQNGNINENITVVPEDVGEIGVTDSFSLIGYLCDADNVKLTEARTIFQGQSTKVCVTPDDEAKAAGVYMRAVDSFVWSRETIYQTAIFTGQNVAPLTELICVPGTLICSFETILKAGFFYTEGIVDGAGSGWLQFGTRNDAVARRVKIVPDESLSRALQNDGDGSDGFAGDSQFEVAQPVQRLYEAIGYLCNEENEQIDPLLFPLRKGDKARVCVRPNEFALTFKIKMRAIDSFIWTRSELEMEQVAISPNAQAAQDTVVSCTAGEVMCVFETVFADDFYRTRGAIEGAGIVWLEFADGAVARRVQIKLAGSQQEHELASPQEDSRQLQSLSENLFPIMEPGFAGASRFSLFVYALSPVQNLERFLCRAYECDESLQEFVSGDVRYEGSSLRICIAPSRLAQEAGASMWAIEWWTWSQRNYTQPAIEPQGREASDGKTLLVCERGMPVCYFQTKLNNEFFMLEDNSMKGDGRCWLTFGGDGFLAKMNDKEEEVPIEQDLIDPARDSLYAGQSDTTLRFAVSGTWYPNKDLCGKPDHQMKVWWDNQDEDMRLLYIAILVTLAAGLFCILCCCLFNNLRRRQEHIGGTDDKVVLNVGIDKSKNVVSKETETTNTGMWSTLKSQLPAGLVGNSNDVEKGERRKSHDMSHKKLLELEEFDGEPSDEDICFGDHHHPGTRDCRKVVRRYIKENREEAYGPGAFKSIKKRLGTIHFLVREDKKDDESDWREAHKREIVTHIGQIWREEKFKKSKSQED